MANVSSATVAALVLSIQKGSVPFGFVVPVAPPGCEAGPAVRYSPEEYRAAVREVNRGVAVRRYCAQFNPEWIASLSPTELVEEMRAQRAIDLSKGRESSIPEWI